MTVEYAQLSRTQRQDVRAAQRTFEGAYIRSAFSELTFGLIILRLFAKEFLYVGTVYTIHAIFMVFLSLYQRQQKEKIFLETPDMEFVTSGHFVLLSAFLTLATHCALLALLIAMGSHD